MAQYLNLIESVSGASALSTSINKEEEFRSSDRGIIHTYMFNVCMNLQGISNMFDFSVNKIMRLLQYHIFIPFNAIWQKNNPKM